MMNKQETKVLTKILGLEGMRVYSHQQHEGIGIILQVESIALLAICNSCGRKSSKLHQNHRYIVKDLSWGEQPVGLKKLGIDEIALTKGQGNYCAVLVDLERSELLAILPSRKQEEIKKVLLSWGVDILERIEEVSIDLWKGSKSLAIELMPNVQVVADRFHVMLQVNKELDGERKKEKRAAVKKLNQTKLPEEKIKQERILAGIKSSKYPLLKNEVNLSEEQESKLIEVKNVSPTLDVIHKLKEEFRKIFEKHQSWLDRLFQIGIWLSKAKKYFPDSYGTVVRWLDEIIAYFDNRTTSGVVEGINNKLKLIKRSGYGFTNFENFRVRCLLN